jgi:SAM-dependent methyltransferase
VIARALRQRLGLRRPVRLGSLRRTTPISDHWGADRGLAIDRYYIDRFLTEHAGDIHGRVLEVMDRRYTERFGLAVSQSDVIDIDASNPTATIVADLTDARGVADASFDCFVLTQTLQFVYEVEAAIREAHRLLAPEGVLLATVPAVSKVDQHAGVDGDFWRLTAASARRLTAGVFGDAQVTVRTYGNVLAAIGFLQGLAREDLSDAELDVEDDLFPVVVAVRGVKA